MNEFPRIRRMGERSVLIEFEPAINENLLEKLLGLKKFIQNELLKQRVEVINTYNSLLVNYGLGIEDVYGEVLKLKRLVDEANIQNKIEKALYHIPVCYEDEFAPDLNFLSAEKKLPKNEIIRLHSEPIYTVYFIGFLPGFLYLGGLDKKLHISRKDQPRLSVPKGAVGIGENQTGIYPQSSPGGWQLIGNSPVPLFDKNMLPPCEISAGDKLKFYPVSLEEYNRISEDVKNGNFSFKKEKYES